ncbi:MAG: spiro-SPASM protein [Treponema sp.]|jgi:spiro-SPASM protein|nr:spiro-SPASM protein [Treponema sp.]
MKAITVLFGGNLGKEAFVPIENEGKSSFCLALERARLFPSVEKLVLLGLDGMDYPGIYPESETFSLIRFKKWTRKQVLETISRLQPGFDIAYFAWADCPFLDPGLAALLTDRHTRYAAEYSYADGYPYGFAPELLSPGTAGILFNIDKDGEVPLTRDALFQVIQKDINAFDIETEISPVDLRQHRLRLAADSKRNLQLINRWLGASFELKGAELPDKIPRAEDAAALIEKGPGLLRTLPAFYNIQVCQDCPQNCTYCPWPQKLGMRNEERGTRYMEKEKFRSLLDKIIEFSSDAVISLSLWGELALHPEKIDLVKMVLDRPTLSLVIETSGIGWKLAELEQLAAAVKAAPARNSSLLDSPLSWIVSLDAFDPNRYKEIRGPGFAEANECVKQLLALFPGNTYIQAVRVQGAEDDIEAFYRFWKDKAGQDQVIVQKYDDFCGKLPKLQASDLSPVKRRPCWHIMRDVCIALDGTVLQCREDLEGLVAPGARPNAFSLSLEEIWGSVDIKSINEMPVGIRFGELYLKHAAGIYPGQCADCDEYYTYNF